MYRKLYQCAVSYLEIKETNHKQQTAGELPSNKIALSLPDEGSVISGKYPITYYSSSISLYRISQQLFLFTITNSTINKKQSTSKSANALHSYTGCSIFLFI